MFRTVVAFALILLTASATQAAAEVQPGDATAGQTLAGGRCSTCHAVQGPPRIGQRGPSLAEVAAMSSTTSLSLHAFLLTSHDSMPNYRLTPQEIDDIVAYILSLRRR